MSKVVGIEKLSSQITGELAKYNKRVRDRVKAVSYTHLDVYKRQVLTHGLLSSSPFSFPCRAVIGAAHMRHTDDDHERQAGATPARRATPFASGALDHSRAPDS